MKRSLLAAVVLLAAFSLLSAAAAGDITELGATSRLAAPTCPPSLPKPQCTIILTEATAVESSSDGVYYPTTVTTAGRVVAYSLGLARLSKTDITLLDSTYGGAPYVELAVLRPARNQQFTYTLVAESKPNFIQPWFGHVTTWPLGTTLRVRPGDRIALTVPTWAPVLAINLPANPFQYRASRQSGCSLQSTYSTQNAQLMLGNTTRYLCRYTATRVEYSATEVTSPPVPRNAVK